MAKTKQDFIRKSIVEKSTCCYFVIGSRGIPKDPLAHTHVTNIHAHFLHMKCAKNDNEIYLCEKLHTIGDYKSPVVPVKSSFS